jgi:Tol biopolymer transport system component
VVSDPAFTEYSGSFSPDGTEYYFYRFVSGSPPELLSTRSVDGVWTDPEPLAIAAGYGAAEPHVTFDDQRLYFMWDRPVPEGESSYLGSGGYYVAERTANGWAEPTYAGQGMFLSSTRDGRLYTTDLSSVQADDTTYLAQITVENGLFTRYDRLAVQPFLGSQAHPCISPDGHYLLFDVDSGSYLFVSFRQADGTWGQAIDLSTYGFDPLAGGATISPDGKYLFFSLRDDIWWVDSEVILALEPKAP